jgi:DNA-binding transcriptional LysR family regulator
MRLNPTIGDQKTEHKCALSASASPDWESVRVFLEVARASSFRTAASHLNMTGHGVANRVTQLESQLGTPLFTRHRDGVRLTADGHHLVSFAEQMEAASFGFIRGRNKFSQPFRGEVRIAATEGLGTFWLTPRLIEFVRAHPQILIDLHCSMQRPDELIVRAQADIAIQIEQPAPRDLIVRRIGRMHIMPCASKSYLNTYGAPKVKSDLIQRHRIAMMYADQGRGSQYYNELFPEHPQTGFMAIRTDASTALYAAVVNGLAIGWLPTYYFSIGAPVVPLDIGCVFPFDIWLSYHADAGHLPRVRRMIDWTIEIFNPQKNPWFRDEFIHPTELEKFLQPSSSASIDSAFAGAKSI